jgi:hypothetical protein
MAFTTYCGVACSEWGRAAPHLALQRPAGGVGGADVAAGVGAPGRVKLAPGQHGPGGEDGVFEMDMGSNLIESNM